MSIPAGRMVLFCFLFLGLLSAQCATPVWRWQDDCVSDIHRV